MFKYCALQLYACSNSDGTEDNALFTPAAGFNDTATITVKVKDASGNCSTDVVFHIAVSAPANVTVSPAKFCMNGYGAVTVTADQPINTIWKVTDTESNFDQVNGNQVMVHGNSSSFTDTLWVVSGTGCCKQYPVSFTADNTCCSASSGLVYDNPTPLTLEYNLKLQNYAADYNTGVIDMNGTTNNKISINGIFNIDTSITFRNCPKITFSPGAITKFITHNTPVYLNARNSTFQNCDDNSMWKGIVDSTTYAYFNSDSSFVLKQAIVGVKSTKGGNVQIKNSTFSDNHEDVRFQNYGSSFSNSYIKTSSFTAASNGLKSPYSNQTKYVAINDSADGALTIGGTSTGNAFSGGTHGVKANGALITLYGNTFTGYGTNQYAVKAKGGMDVLTVGATASGKGNTFISDSNAISSSYGTLTVQANNFTNCQTAVEADNASGKTLKIKNNNISNAQIGIYCYNNPGAHFDIGMNTISTHTATGTTPVIAGIYISETGPVTDYDNVYDNVITSKGIYGIYTLNVSYLTLKNNTINPFSLSLSTPTYGIRNEGGQGLKLYCNTITGNVSSASSNIYAISISASTVDTLTSNSTDKAYYGLQISGNSNGMRVLSNSYYDHRVAIQLGLGGSFSTMGDQLVRKYDGVHKQIPGDKFYANYTGSVYQLGGNSGQPTNFAYNNTTPYRIFAKEPTSNFIPSFIDSTALFSKYLRHSAS
ncbi:MAG: right-handed parallel beta-helix repeat-containing protein [Chitinophagales bacterium]|nr:right-handed parallel beta-helix repeat-containing protein [Chitinophagales bacterium]